MVSVKQVGNDYELWLEASSTADLPTKASTNQLIPNATLAVVYKGTLKGKVYVYDITTDTWEIFE